MDARVIPGQPATGVSAPDLFSRPVQRIRWAGLCTFGVPLVLPHRDRSAPEQGRTAQDQPSTLRIEDLGDEVHLWVAQRVPWPVALEILRLLKVPDEPAPSSSER